MKIKKFYDLAIEKNILTALLTNKNFSAQSLTYNRLLKEHFTDLVHLDAFTAIIKFYNKYGKAPRRKQFIIYLKKYMTFQSDAYKSRDSQQDIWSKLGVKLYNRDISDVDIKSEFDALEHYRKLRLVQKSTISLIKNIEQEKIEAIYTDLTKAVGHFNIVENTITQGNIVDDLREHFILDKRIKSGEKLFIPSNIIGVIDKDNKKPKPIKLDNLILGGIYPKEMVLLVGEQNVGKSFALMEFPYIASKFYKKNSVLMTIEMDKIKQQRRIYSRATRIPYYKFKLGELTKEDKKKLLEWKEQWKEQCGIYEVVAFEKGATVIDIANKVDELENHYGEPFHMCSVDYLNDLRPTGKHGNDRDWTALGDISWELALLSKYHDNHRGICMITGNQKKTKLYGKSDTKAGSAFGSALPEHHATVAIGIGQDEDDAIMKRIRWDVFKNREGAKQISFYTYTDYAISRISSIKRMKEYYKGSDDGATN